MSFVQMTSDNIFELHDIEPGLTVGFMNDVVSLGDRKNQPSTLPSASTASEFGQFKVILG